MGKKVADASALKSKLDAFFGDIKARFDKAIAGVAINRELYNLNFKKITDEYENKIGKIGEHIFQVKLEDVAPAVRAAQVPYEDAHSLPIEMDLKRLSARAENLDETLGMLKASRLDEAVSWLGTLDSKLNQYSTGNHIPGEDVSLCVEGIAVMSPNSSKILMGLLASKVTSFAGVSLSAADESLQVFGGAKGRELLAAALVSQSFRDLEGPEIIALSKAAATLFDQEMISGDAKAMFEDFLGSGNLKVLAA